MPTTSWELRLRALTAFIASEGREPSLRAVTPGEHRLAGWLDEQRKSARAGRIGDGRLQKLRGAGLLGQDGPGAQPRTGAAWLRIASIQEFLDEEGRLPSLTSPASAGEKRLAAWMHAHLAGRSMSTEAALALREVLARAEGADDPMLTHVG